MPSPILSNQFSVNFNFGVNNLLVNQTQLSQGELPPVSGNFELLDGTPFLLLDGTDFLLL